MNEAKEKIPADAAGKAASAGRAKPAGQGGRPAGDGPAAAGDPARAKPAGRAGAKAAPAAGVVALEGQTASQDVPAAASKPPGEAGKSAKPAGQGKAGSAGRARAKPGGKPAAAEPDGAARDAAPKEPEFRALRTTGELVEAYNDMLPTVLDLGMKPREPVRMFVDVATGQQACERLHSLIHKARQTVEKSMAKKSKAKKAKTGGSRTKIDLTKRIKVLVKENPCRKGTKRYARVQKLLDHAGKTAGEFLKKGKTGTLAYSIRVKWVVLV